MRIQLQFEPVIAELDMILNGILLTIGLSAGAIILGSALAILLVGFRSLAGRWAGVLVDAYVELMRNTPFLVQLFMIFFGLPLLGLRIFADPVGSSLRSHDEIVPWHFNNPLRAY